MLKGFIEKRVSNRTSFDHEIKIKFEENNQGVIDATATDISAGGLQFQLPWGSEFVEHGTKVDLFFDLPLIGETTITGEIRYLRPGVDANLNRIVAYGIKFIDITLEMWNYIFDYCHSQLEVAEPDTPPNHSKERQDIRVTVKLKAEIQIADQRTFKCLIEDISFGGMRIKLAIPLPLNTTAKITILDNEPPFAINGLSVWSKPKEDETVPAYETGIYFTRLNLETYNLLRELIFRLHP